MPYHPIHSEDKFYRARRQAFFQDIFALLRRQSPDLLSFEEVAEKLHAHQEIERGLQVIPLDRIVGSVGRYRDFTRTFLPRQTAARSRWKSLDQAINTLEDIPPIEVYKVGQVYFVRDGNHRVSVARANGFKDIEAYVTEVQTPVPLDTGLQPDQLIIKQEYADFLHNTHLDQLQPEQNIEFTTPGRYDDLLEHISVHRYYLGRERQRDVPYPEAVASWYDTVYMPVIQAIRQNNMLAEFPKRTEADLYLWTMNHLYYLREEYGDVVNSEIALEDLAERYPERNPLQKAVDTAVTKAKEIPTGDDVPPVVYRLLDRFEKKERAAGEDE